MHPIVDDYALNQVGVEKIEIRINAECDLEGLPQATHWPRLAAHEREWSAVQEEALGHASLNLSAHAPDGKLIGYLPLTHVRSIWFGQFLVSQPYLNTGGVWADEEAVALALVDRAVAIADELGVKHLELRHEIPVPHPRTDRQRTDKVHMRLALPESSEALMKSFKSKLRSQVKKTFEHPFEIQWGGLDLVNDFYIVFARNMRDLGTPVYTIKLFESILRHFSSDAELAVVRLRGQLVAGALLMHRRGRTEVPSASCLREFNPTGANMWMYWQLLQRAIERGSIEFDFGRSSVDSGTYKFKEQWGALPQPAIWQFYVRSGAPEDMRPTSPKRQRMIQAWQKLPVWFTKVIGPSIVRGIP